MHESRYASIESQLGNEICSIEDTEEMFWNRESDDYDSIVSLGNALASQYRFKEAVDVYRKALKIKSNDPLLYIRIAGANLSLFRFEESKEYYEKAIIAGASYQSVSFYIGIWNYLKANYQAARECFENSYSTADYEMKISLIYWHTLSSFKDGSDCQLLKKYEKDIDAGHHMAYKKAVDVFFEEKIREIDDLNNPLDKAIFQYGMSVYYKHQGNEETAKEYLNKTLEHKEVWPCVSYLAAWNDFNNSN